MHAAQCDVLVIGSGSAALSAALRAAKGGLSVIVAEKSDLLGGTSAMSGAGIWIPANHLARRAGIADSGDEALEYIRSASPEGWRAREDGLWQAFALNAPRMLAFLGETTPLEFELADQADPLSEHKGGKPYGRMLSPAALRRNVAGAFAGRLRRSPLPHIFTYREIYAYDLRNKPIRGVLRLWPKLLKRFLTNSGGQGTALMTGLIKGCLDAGCDIRLRLPATGLVTNLDGAVTGADFTTQDGGMQRISARRGVVVATGGFEWNAALRDKHFPGPEYLIGSPPTNAGEGQEMAAAAGAQLERMDQANVYLCYPTGSPSTGSVLPPIFHVEPHSILVDRNGRRFASEGDFNLGEIADRRDAATRQPLHLPIWLVADRRFPSGAAQFRRYRRSHGDHVVSAPTVAALAGKLGLPAPALEETVARFNHLCSRGRDEEFGRGETLWERSSAAAPIAPFGALEQPPFIGVRMERFIVGTKGGIRTNASGQALRADGSIIPRLYAAGLAMANPIGSRGIGAGTTLGPNLTWGYICAETILSNNTG